MFIFYHFIFQALDTIKTKAKGAYDTIANEVDKDVHLAAEKTHMEVW